MPRVRHQRLIVAGGIDQRELVPLPPKSQTAMIPRRRYARVRLYGDQRRRGSGIT